MSQRRLDEFTTVAIRKDQKEKLDVIKSKNKLKTYAEVVDLLIETYESLESKASSNTEKVDDNEVVEEVETFQSAVMPQELETIITETCKNNPEMRAYVMFFIKKYNLEKFRAWAERWNREIDCSQWNT
ncbi:MAG: hypothetical protein N3G79_06935 [Sulfolobales archaeon]|nr:hypothetical protein [Sulfolobales archaeon]